MNQIASPGTLQIAFEGIVSRAQEAIDTIDSDGAHVNHDAMARVIQDIRNSLSDAEEELDDVLVDGEEAWN